VYIVRSSLKTDSYGTQNRVLDSWGSASPFARLPGVVNAFERTHDVDVP